MPVIESHDSVRAFVILLSVLLFGSYATSLSATEQQRRFSIAISGGASRGAYEAGLNWGLLKMGLDIDKIDRAVIGHARNRDDASFSGVSAGGINTLLSGLTWCSLPQTDGGLANTIDVNILRDVWLIPDVNHMPPLTVNSEFYRADDALFARHGELQAAR